MFLKIKVITVGISEPFSGGLHPPEKDIICDSGYTVAKYDLL